MELKIKTIEDLQKIPLKVFTLVIITFLFLLITPSNGFSQVCESGAMFVSGPGCGCISGCDLTPLGGPNCGGGTSGNCTGGHQTMSTTFIVPAGCDVRITAEMKIRAGSCTASGADGTSTSGDRLRIRNGAGPTPAWQIGGSNASLFDQMTVTGPATIFIEGASNRADEIITYIIEDVGGCNCSQILPITLVSFFGEAFNETTNVLKWITSTEINNDFFTLERSSDAINFEPIATISGAGNSNQINNYSAFDYIQYSSSVTHYYRLKQTDFDGKFTYSDIVVLNNNFSHNVYYNHTLQQLEIGNIENGRVDIYNLQGQKINSFTARGNNVNLNLAKGMYLVSITNGIEFFTKKIVVN